MRTIHIMSGVPGCGKTTYINYNAKENDCKLHRDEFRSDLRKSLNTDKYFPVSANEEWDKWMGYVNYPMQLWEGDIWIDQTTNGTGALAKLLKGIDLRQDDTILIHIFKVPLEVCLRRNSLRKGLAFVPEDTITEMHSNFLKRLITTSSLKRLLIQEGITNEVKIVTRNE